MSKQHLLLYYKMENKEEIKCVENISNKMTAESLKEFKPSLTLDNIKIDVNKVLEFRKKNVKKLEEVLAFLWESYATCSCWAKLTPFQQYCLVEQTFLVYFATFPARIQCAAALAALDELDYYLSKETSEKMSIRSAIKRLALTIKFTSKNKGFTISEEDAKLAKDLIENGLDKKVIAILFTEELYNKISKKWSAHKL